MTQIDNIFQSDFDFVIKQTRNAKVGNKSHLQISTTTEKNDPKQQGRSPSTPEKDYRVSLVFYPIILASKCTGLCPVKITRKPDGTILYEFKWISLQFIVSLLAGIIVGVVLFIWILNTTFNIPWPAKIFRSRQNDGGWLNDSLFKGSQLVVVLNSLIKISLPFGGWISLLLAWGDVRSLCDFLNDWPNFIHQYNLAFSSYYTVQFRLNRARNITCAFWLTPVLLLMFFTKPVNYFDERHAIIGYIFGYSQIPVMLGTRALSYVKDFLLLETVKSAYDEMLNGIKAEYGKCQKSITRDQVREWMDMVHFVRKQSNRLESHISCHNLWSVFEIFANVLIILSMVVFLFMNNALGNSLGNFLPFSLVCTGFFICSLFWKTEIAEQIVSKEEEIAEELLEMETADDDCETRLEMKLICDVIYNDPVQIRVGNVLTLNKQLLLSFFSQLASYLVVILQFTKT